MTEQEEYQEYVRAQQELSGQDADEYREYLKYVARQKENEDYQKNFKKGGILDKSKYLGLETLQRLGKALDTLRGGTMAPAIAGLLEMQSGKDVYRPQEHLDAINPLNSKKFPSIQDLYDRAGYGKLSTASSLLGDVSPQLKEVVFPKENDETPWWRPVEGGAFDLTLDTAIDPATWVTMGGSRAAKSAFETGASRMAAKEALKETGGFWGNLGRGVRAIPDKVTDVVTGVNPWNNNQSINPMAPLSQKVKPLASVLSVPSKMLGGLGTMMYNSVVQPIENQAMKFNKRDSGELLYRLGKVMPDGQRLYAQKIVPYLVSARDKLIKNADDAGARVEFERWAQAARERIEKLRSTSVSAAHHEADLLERELAFSAKTLGALPGQPGIAPSISKKESGLFDLITGKPEYEVTYHPGRDPVPPTPPRPQTVGEVVEDLSVGNMERPTMHNATAHPQLSDASHKTLQGSKKQAMLDEVERVSGTKAATDINDLNQDIGMLSSTKQGQIATDRRAQVHKGKMVAPTAADTAIHSALEARLEGTGGKYELLRRLGETLRYGVMPGGYALRKTAENPLAGPFLDTLVRNKLIDMSQQRFTPTEEK